MHSKQSIAVQEGRRDGVSVKEKRDLCFALLLNCYIFSSEHIFMYYLCNLRKQKTLPLVPWGGSFSYALSLDSWYYNSRFISDPSWSGKDYGITNLRLGWWQAVKLEEPIWEGSLLKKINPLIINPGSTRIWLPAPIMRDFWTWTR